MVDRATLEQLIADLEGATEGSWGLSEGCLLVAGWQRTYLPGRAYIEKWVAPGDPYNLRDCPSPTRNLGDALVMIPQPWIVTHAYWNSERAAFNLTLSPGVYAEGRATTPALALCAASLRARLAEMDDG